MTIPWSRRAPTIPTHTTGALLAIQSTMAAEALRITNVGTTPMSQVLLTDGRARYRVGYITMHDALADLCPTVVPTAEDRLFAIWSFFVAKFRHLCSHGSPLAAVYARETVLNRFYSYAFGSCDDMNQLLGAFLDTAGFDVAVLRSPEHVALDVSTGRDHYYVDADLKRVEKGPIHDLVRSGREPFAFFADGHCAPLRLPVAPVGSGLYPGDVVTLSLVESPELVFRPWDRRNPYSRGTWEVGHAQAVKDMRVGVATLRLAPRATRAVAHGRDVCADFQVTSPCVLLSAEVLGLSPTGQLLALLPHSDGHRFWAEPIRGSSLTQAGLAAGTASGCISPADMRTDWGGYAVRTHLNHLAERIITDSGEDWFTNHVELQLFEDGCPLGPLVSGPSPEQGRHRDAPEHRAIIEDGHGRYRLYQDDHLVFSSSDGTNPVTNGRTYRYTVPTYRARYSARGRYQLHLRVHDTRDAIARLRIQMRFQYHRGLMPSRLEAIRILDSRGGQPQVATVRSEVA